MSAAAERQVAFVAGATGYVGQAVVDALVSRGVRTVAHVRPDSPALADWRGRFAAMGAEVDPSAWDDAALSAALAAAAPTHVFALLGTTRARERARGNADTASGYERVDYGLTAMLLRAARTLPRPPVFVYLSSAGVSDRAGNPYLRVRWRLESELRLSGLPFVIVRPSFITGPDRAESRPAERIGAAVLDALLALLAALGARRLADRWRSITARDLAGALATIALDPQSRGLVVDGEDLR